MSKKSPAPTYMFLFRSSKAMPDPSPEEMQAVFGQWMTWIETMKKKGQYLGGDPLEDAPGKVLRGPRGGKVTDGPFAEAKEIVGGYMLIKAASFAEAVKIAKGAPSYNYGGCVEVRQLMPFHM
ncbi:MAG: YciI family protein [Verrucomicrobia bacterium]|nr:YciI family protein [Verrucomicrobiota bacterium]